MTKLEIRDKIFEACGTVFNIDNKKQLAVILFEVLKLKLINGSNSLSIKGLNELKDQHQIITLLLEYKKAEKIEKYDLFNHGRIYIQGKVVREGYEELREECEALEAFMEGR